MILTLLIYLCPYYFYLGVQKRKAGGRPSGTTNDKKRISLEIIKQAKNDIIMNYVRIIDNDNCHEITKKGLFQCLVKEQKMTYNLPDSFHFPYETALSRIKRKNLTACGNDCPLKKVESQFVFILLCMSRLNMSLRPFESLTLINECINGTSVQKELIEWKLKRKIYFSSADDLGKVGKSYWRSFL